VNAGTIRDCYALAATTGTQFTGGLAGGDLTVDGIQNCYAAGAVSGSSTTGGLAGFGNGASASSFYDSEIAGQPDNGYGTPKTSAEMKDVATFSDTDTSGLAAPWDFAGDPHDDAGTEDVWNIDPGINSGYPYLMP
jgi:hypothetical protein